MKKKKIMIIAGEPSGDLHAASLIKSLKNLEPNLEFFGVGGEKMQDAGAEIIYNIAGLAIVGFFEVLRHILTFKNLFKNLALILEKRKPNVVILVDYPGFNLRFARIVKEKNIPVIYYISPQIWAWGKNRIEEIKQCVDKMIVIFGFEENIYREAGVKVNFVGHPLLDIVKTEWKKDETLKRIHLRNNSIKISLLPGSRQKEIKMHLPKMLEACGIINKSIPEAEFILSAIKELPQNLYADIIARSKIKPHILENRPYEAMDIADIVIVSSGSATLETAIMDKPMVIIYKTSLITWLLAKNMIKIPDIGLVNIVAGKRIVPELIQFNVTGKNISRQVLAILNNKKLMLEIKENLRIVKNKLGQRGAIDRASHAIYKFLL